MIVEDKDYYQSETIQSGAIIDWNKIKQSLSLYKFPLILAGIGILFLFLGVVYIIRTQTASSEVIFSEASPSSTMAKFKIQVDVEGAVRRPGVYEVEEGSRITAALSAAGGLSADADRDWVSKNMNLAMKVVDGGKIYIPSTTEISTKHILNSDTNISGASGHLLGVTAGKVNINTASQGELEGLPGVGSVTAVKIIKGRPYQLIEELKSKKVVGNALFEKLKDLITI